MTNSQAEDTVWPSSADDLVDTHLCPGCFAPIVEMTCRRCGLVLSDPRTTQLLELGRAIAASEHTRRQLIAEIRRAHLPASVPVAPPVPVPERAEESFPPPAPEPVSTPPAAGWDQLPPPDAADRRPTDPAPVASPVADIAPAASALRPPRHPGTPPPAAPAAAPARRKLSVPVLLLIVGVALVGVAAIFFLLLAWFVAGIAVRALIIGAITAVTITAASVLRRRELTATAEGIAVLGVILLALDAWAVRANDLFGTGALRPAVYAGIAALLVGVVLRAWARLSKLRGPDLAAVIALPAGLGMLIGGLTSLPTEQAFVAGLLGASIGGLAWALPAPWSAAREPRDAVPERVTLAVIGAVALIGATGVAAVASPDGVAFTLWSTPAILAVSIAHAVLLRPQARIRSARTSDADGPTVDPALSEPDRMDVAPEVLPWARILFATVTFIGAVVAGALGWQLAVRDGGPLQVAFLGPVIAVAVAVLLDRLGRGALRIATVAASIVGTVSLLIGVTIGGARAVRDLTLAWALWQTPSFERPAMLVETAELSLWCALGAFSVAILLFAAPTLARPVWRDARVAASVALTLLAATLTAIPAVVVLAAVVLAAVCVIFVARRSAAQTGWRIAAGLAAATAYLVGLTQPGLWLVGIASALAVPIAVHTVTSARGAAAVRLTLVPVAVATISAFVAPGALAAAAGLPTSDPAVPFVLVQWVALVALAVAVALPVDRITRATLAVSSFALIVLSFAGALLPFIESNASGDASVSLLGEPVAAMLRTTALTALLTIVALGRSRVTGVPVRFAALLAAPVAASALSAVFDTSGVADDPAAPLAVIGVAVTVTWAAALTPARVFAGTPSDRRRVRVAADVGALSTGVLTATVVGYDRLWVAFLLAAIGFAAAAVTRGWAAPLTAALPGVVSTRAAGLVATAAARRLLSWPALALGTLSLWLWLGTLTSDLTVEAFLVPPAVGMIAFAGALIWLRRHTEAAIAGALGALAGLVIPALASWAPDGDLRGVIVAAVAATVCLALSWTALRRLRWTALVTTTIALGAFAIVALERTADPRPDGVDASALWCIGLVALAYVSAVGFVAGRRGSADAAPEAGYALIVPPLTLAVAASSVLPEVRHPLTLTVAVGLCLLLHLAAAWWNRRPFAASTRWTALAAGATLAGAALTTGAVTNVEMLSVPLAVALLGGAALALWRRAGADAGTIETGERGVWLIGLAVALFPSIGWSVEPVRMWLVIAASLLAAIGCAVAPATGTHRLAQPSAALLAGGALLMGARALTDGSVTGGDSAALVAGAGGLLVAATMVRMTAPERPGGLSSIVSAAAATLLVATTISQGVTASGDTGARTALTAVIAGVLGVGGAALLRFQRWRAVAASLAVGGLVAAVTSIALRFVVVSSSSSFGIEPDLWAVAGVGLVAAIGIAALRSSVEREIELAVGGVFTVTVLLFALAATVLLGADPTSDGVRALVTMSALTLAGFGALLWRTRLGITLPIAVLIALVLYGLTAMTLYGVTPVEVVTAPPAVGLLALGARRLRRVETARSWPTLGPGLALLTVPSLLFDFGQNELWRVVSLGIVVVVIVIIGAVGKLQAPLVLGSVVLLVHAVAQLWPWISTSYVAVPWWLWLGIGGAVLIVLAARYEKQMRALRTAFTAVSSLR